MVRFNARGVPVMVPYDAVKAQEPTMPTKDAAPQRNSKSKKAFQDAKVYEGFRFDPDDLVLITDKNHPLYDPRVTLPVDEALVKNIMFQGVIEPVVISKGPEGKPVVVDGRQRVRAAREANLRLDAAGMEIVLVPCVLRKGTESDLFGVLISANENRTEDTPLGRAQKCARYLSMGRSHSEAAVAFGVSVACVRQWMQLLDCSPKVRKAVETKKIAASAALKLVELPIEEQDQVLGELLTGAGLADTDTVASTGEVAGSTDDPGPQDSLGTKGPEKNRAVKGVKPATKTAAKSPAKSAVKPKKKRISARHVAAVVAGDAKAGEAAPKMKGRRAILAKLKEDITKDFRAGLLWVLGEA